jgi:hypothetical protein
MGIRKWFFIPFFLLLILIAQTMEGKNCTPRPARKVYVGSFGRDSGAAYMRGRLLAKLARSREIVLVDDPSAADLSVRGHAKLWVAGHWHSNPRVQDRSTPVYDARMTIEIDDARGRMLWSGGLKPRFWGSQYVSDNVAIQAAEYIVRITQ